MIAEATATVTITEQQVMNAACACKIEGSMGEMLWPAYICTCAAIAMQAFTGADIIVHEIGDNVTFADLQQKPAAARDDRLVSAHSS